MNVSAMSVYHHMTYPYTSTASQIASGQSLVGSSGSGVGAGPGPASPGCGCEAGRVVATDPVTGAAICSCQYDASPSRLSVSTHLNVNAYPRLAAPAPGSALHYSAAYAGGDPQSAYPSIGVDPAYFGSLGGAYGFKDSTTADMGVYGGMSTAATYGYNPYDPSLYGYGAPYDLAARRKNATREATGTLKAWMNEHKKNPYPTKGEKIMLAIITKMTLTQISTWFANARRRLKKENKMTWTPKNKTDSDDEGAKDTEGEDKDDASEKDDTDKDTSMNSSGAESALCHDSSNVEPKPESRSSCDRDSAEVRNSPEDPLKPKIWSLADTAVCKTPPQGVAWSSETRLTSSDVSGTTFPLPPTIGSRQLQRFSPYSRQASTIQNPASWSRIHESAEGSDTKLGNYDYATSSKSFDPQKHYDTSKIENYGKSYKSINPEAYEATSVYGTAGTVTPPQTPPSVAVGTQGTQVLGTSDVPGYTASYPGVLSALERRTDVYSMHPYWRQ